MRGYWNNPEDTAAAFHDGFFRTGDIGYQDANGYFYILDRLKDMIVTGGENVYCGEVEAVILNHPAVREVAVFGIPDPQVGRTGRRMCRAEAADDPYRRSFDCALPREPRQLQSPPPNGVFAKGLAEERLGQNTQTPVARSVLGARGSRSKLGLSTTNHSICDSS